MKNEVRNSAARRLHHARFNLASTVIASLDADSDTQTKATFLRTLAFFWLLLLGTSVAIAQSDTSSDPHADESTNKALARNFVVVPIPMSNPTLETGLVLGGAYFYPQSAEEAKIEPASVTAVGGMYTNQALHALLVEQDSQLAALQNVIAGQQEEIEKQRTLLQSVQAQLDQMASNRNAGAGLVAAEQPSQSVELEELIAAQPESTKLGEDFTDSIPIPGTDAALKMGGFVKMSLVRTFDPLGKNDRFITGLIPVGVTQSTVELGNFNVSARQSRFGFELRDATDYGTLRAFVEGDFAGSGDTYRLRHAFAQFRHYLAGKTWSTMVDNRATPEEVDFEGINGRIQVRQAQVRFFPSFGRHLDLLIGLEDSAPDVTGGQGVSEYPDLVASVRRNWANRFHVKTSVLLRQIQARWDVDPTVTDDKFGWGVSVSGNVGVNVWDERDRLMFQFNYGDGIGRYINDLQEIGGQDAVFNPLTGQLETLSVFSSYVAFQHWWRETLRSTWTYSWVDVDNLDFQNDSDYARTDRAIVNLLWSPVPRIDIGAEFLWGRRENNDGAKGIARQFQFGAKYRF